MNFWFTPLWAELLYGILLCDVCNIVVCYIKNDKVNIPLPYKLINNHQSWPSLQQIPLDKHQSETTNHKARQIIQVYKCETRNTMPTCMMETSYPSMYSKGTVQKELQDPRTVGVAVGIRRAQIQEDQQSRNRASNFNTPWS